MRLSTLNQIICPNDKNKYHCGGQLFVANDVMVPILFKDSEEVDQGILVCSKCYNQYPIIAGIPIFVDLLDDWLRKNHSSILTGLNNCSILSDDMQNWLENHEWSYGNSKSDDYYADPRWLQIFIQTHYDSERPGSSDESPVGEALANQKHVFEVCHDMLNKAIDEPVAWALDVGCNVGGMTYRLESFANQTIAIDTAFNALLIARRILLQSPKAINTGFRRMDGVSKEFFEIHARNSKADFILSSLEYLSFKNKFNLVTALNVIDCVRNPLLFLEKLYSSLEIEGLLLLTSPYSWTSDDVPMDNWLGTSDGFSSDAIVIQTLTNLGMELLEEKDKIPWVLTEHKRWYRVFSNHCILMKKTK